MPGQSTDPLIDDLLSRGHEFSFSQVMRVARMHLGAGGAGELPEIPWQERVRIRPDLCLAFPTADVARVDRAGEDGTHLLVTATFLGLYGTSSPLPNHYTEDLVDEAAADSSASRDFLDILHQRLYHLYFQCWDKYRLFIRMAEEKNPRDLERLFCLMGLGGQELRESVPDAPSLLRYAGLFSQSPRSAIGLQTLLRDALGVAKLKVEQCILRKVVIPENQRTVLGIANLSLGVDTFLGSEVADRMGKFRIQIGPLSRGDFNAFLPGTPRHDKLAALITLYLVDPFDYDVKLLLAAGDAPPIHLGASDALRLGLNSWSFSGDTLGEVSVIFPSVHSAKRAPIAVRSDEFDSAPDEKAPSTLIEHFQEELARLRELAAAYANSHPALASMVTGNPADPSVERLFEGVAFLNAHLLQKLDDDWPEIIQDIIAAVEPNYLRPTPASTIVAFSPKTNCRRPQLIPVGTELKSVPVDGTACRFTTRYPVEIHPLILTNASFSHQPGKPPTITLNLKLTGLCLNEWHLKSLRLFLAGNYGAASDLYLVLMHFLKRIIIAPIEEGQSLTLDATHLRPVGFEDCEELFPHGSPCGSDNQCGLVRDFIILPEKFLFLDIHGWERWRRRGKGAEFEIRFELDKPPCDLRHVNEADFALFATPAINVFKHKAEPITIDTEHGRYPVTPADKNSGPLELYSIERVSGIKRKTSSKIPFVAGEVGRPDSATTCCYDVTRQPTSLHDETYLSITSTAIPLAQISSLVIDVTCTNGKLPERLHIGDIWESTDSSPTFAEFSNCTPVTRSEVEAKGNNLIWRQFSNSSMNLAVLDATTLRAMIDTLSGSSSRAYSRVGRHGHFSDGITDVRVAPVDRLMESSVRRGWEIRITVNQESYISSGDLYLFGAVLDRLLSGFASQSGFTKTILEGNQDERYQWPARKGIRPLL